MNSFVPFQLSAPDLHSKRASDPLRERFLALPSELKTQVGARVLEIQDLTESPRQAARIAIAFTEQSADRERTTLVDAALAASFPASDPRGFGTAVRSISGDT